MVVEEYESVFQLVSVIERIGGEIIKFLQHTFPVQPDK